MARIAIIMEGGLIQNILSDEPIESLMVVDYDTEGADEEGIRDVPQSDGGTAEAYVSRPRIETSDAGMQFLDALDRLEA